MAAGLEVPVAGPSSLTTSIEVPSAGPSSLVGSSAAPSEGPSGLSAEIPTLNIAPLYSDQSFADDPNSGSLGEIRYSSDVEYLFIHNGAEWRRTDGGNS